MPKTVSWEEASKAAPDPPPTPPAKSEAKPFSMGDYIGGKVRRLRSDFDAAYRTPLKGGAGKPGAEPGTPEARAEEAADRLGGDILDVPASLLKAPIKKFINNPLEHALGMNEGDMGALERVGSMFVGNEAGGTAFKAGEPWSAGRIAASQGKAGERAALQRNVEAMDKIKVKPSLAVAHPNKSVRQVAQQLGNVTAVGEPVHRAVRNSVAGVAQRAEEAARKVGTPQSAEGAGRVVQEAAKRFVKASPPSERAAREGLAPESQDAVTSAARLGKSRDLGFGRKADVLYEDAERKVGPAGAAIDMPHTTAALNDVRYRINDPAFTGFQEHPQVTELFQRLEEQQGKMSFSGARRLRSIIRETLRADPSLKASASDAEIEGLYRSMTKDLREGAAKHGGPAAARAFDQADAYYKAGRERIDKALDQTFGSKTPAQVFYDLVTDAREGRGEDLKRLMQVRRSLKPEEWHDVSASILDHMGRALPGQRTEETQTSFRTFLTNFEKMAGDSRHLSDQSIADSGLKVLFQGAGLDGSYEHIRDIARVASSLKESDKFYNHSQSGAAVANFAAAGVAADALHAVATGQHGEALGAFATLLTGRAMAMVLESPKVARFVAQLAKNEDATLAEEIARLDRVGKTDPEMADFAKLVRQNAGLGAAGASAAGLASQSGSDDQPAPKKTVAWEDVAPAP